MSANPPISRHNISRWALEHPALTRYLLVALMVLGFFAYFQLGQDEDPPFTFRAMVVRTFWPGATAEQVAEQVTSRLERTLQEVPYADKIDSYSKPGESLIIFQLAEQSPPAEVPQLWYTVRKKIGDMAYELPSGVQGPFFVDDFGDVYGVIYALSGEGYSYAELKDAAEDVRQRLLRVPDVAKIELFGEQDERIYIEAPQGRLSQLGLNMNEVLAQLGQQNAVAAAGAVQGPGEQVLIRVEGQFGAIEDLRAMPIRAAGGQQLRLGDIAEVRRGYVDPPSVKVRFQGQPVIALGISMAKGGDIVALGKALHAEANALGQTLPAGMQLTNVQDQPKAVTTAVNDFVKVLIEAVVIVLAVSFLSLGLHKRAGNNPPWRRYTLDVRPGMVVAITIPLVLSLTFLAMMYWGIGLHKISLGSLIIALGLLVDDAIIAVEMMVRKMEEGYGKFRSACFAYDITAKPMLTGTLITAAGFLPIGIAKSMTGEYTFAIFGVTVVALLLSWIVSVYFVPYLGVLLLKKPAHAAEIPNAPPDTLASLELPDPPVPSPQSPQPGAEARVGAGTSAGAPAPNGMHDVYDTPFYQRFRRAVDWCVQHRWLTIGLTLLLFLAGLFGMTRVQQQFFPDSSRPEIMVDVWLPEGASFQAIEDVAERAERAFMHMDEIDNVATWVGSGVPRFYLPLDQIFPQTNVAQFILQPHSLAERNTLLDTLPQYLAEHFPEVRTRVKLLPMGPPVPYPVQFRVVGSDPQLLRERADAVKAILAEHPSMRGVNDNWNEPVKTLRLSIDQDKALALGVNSQAIARGMNMILEGEAIGQYREGDKLISIMLRPPLDERETLTDLGNAYINTALGGSIPLSQIATAEMAWEPGVMWRSRRDYTITVQGDVVEGVQGATVTDAVLPRLRELERQWHANGETDYRIEVAGAVEESAKGAASIAAGVPLMIFIVFTLLVIQLKSFARAMLVFLTGPLGITGVAAALLISGKPFGFVALLGVIALMGMIQRNAVILIDQIEMERADGVPAWDAILDAAMHRLRPIALTAAAAVLAMIPLSRNVFWGPMAISIMGGLLVATVLTLLALPAMYAAWFRVRRPQEGETARAG
ncbi:efflux RND transporter permease subunit [Corticibacter populi]|uniref:Efflux RND transporter permease subunit n=1 Tax=Corticibacter populi TaxID=1550736 RepID=A0A3M6QSE1_9BURK|nr:efflux RND transporter permease subunit [Corticibacter populi]RMX05944.1 efflux RND transporter permease subunit [Corticibacter populi]RZS30731.1 multidrug efflux pump subunit AcrB [Corticibacter populi]